jgi:hypothetical protein
MPNDLISAEVVETSTLRERIETALLGLTRDEHTRALAIALFVFATALMLMYKPFSQIEVGDSAGYDYIAQSILRGQLPYRDVVDIKSPGSMYLSAGAMAAGKLVGLGDVVSVRLFQSLLVGLLCVVTFYVARAYLRNTMAALIAAVFPLVSYKFAEWMVVGTQPKLSMMLFGMLSLLFIAKDKPFLAGAFSMLSFLCWQPGLMFTGVAVLMFSRYLTSWRDLRAMKVVIGSVLPLAIVLGYFYSQGALQDLWAWTITFNYSVFGPETQRGPLLGLNHIWSVTKRAFGPDAVLAPLGVAGFVMFAAQRIQSRLNKSENVELFRDAILIPPVIYFAFCIINMQSGPDLIPFVPFFGMFSGWLLVRLGELAMSREQSRRRKIRWELLAPGAALTLFLFVALARGAAYRIPPGFTLQDQDRAFEKIAALLGPDDKVYVHGYAELLVLLNRPNLNPYPFLNQGIDGFAASRRGGDFKLILDEMESQRPKLVVLARLKTVASRELLERWVDEHYTLFESSSSADVYIRKGA